MPIISIIVPVFNEINYVNRCIESLLRQSLEDIEIILVDDGSTDGSDAVCDSYKYDQRVRVIHQVNKGPSSARNAGISVAKGKYIGFVDSDDFVAEDMYEKMLCETAGESIDVIFCNYSLAKTNGVISSKNNYWAPVNKTLYSDEIKKILISDKNYELLWFVWKGIYKRELLIENEIQFIEGMYGEDSPFNLEVLLSAESIRIIDSPLYYYVQTQNSLVRTKYKEHLSVKLNEQYLAKKEIFEKHQLIGYEQSLYDYTLRHSIVMLLSNELNSQNSLTEMYRTFKQMRNCEMVKDAFEYANDYGANELNIMFLISLLKNRCYLLLSIVCKLYYYCRKIVNDPYKE